MKIQHIISVISIVAICWCAGIAQSAGAASESLTDKKALILKAQGDKLAKKMDFAGAAEDYEKALTKRNIFTMQDRLEMSRVLAWGGKLDAAAKELELITDANPNDLEAKTLLAQVRYWSDMNDEALVIVDTVLQSSPFNREALRIKADILHDTEPEVAIAIYKGLLDKKEDFDVRMGLTHAYIQAGMFKDARQELAELTPEYPYQTREITQVSAFIDRAENAVKAEVAQAENPAEVVAEVPSMAVPLMPIEAPVATAEAAKAAEEVERLLKSSGDQMEEKGDHKGAAKEYLKALNLPHEFSKEERLQMAKVISWAGLHKESRHELELLLAEHPDMIAARLQFARVLYWSGDPDKSMKEANNILVVEPDNKDATVVKASDLRISGNYKQAEILYRTVLDKQEDYDAREGLIYAYISSGNRVEAERSLALLNPSESYQKKDYQGLIKSYNQRFNPSVYGGVSYYHDSDHNNVTRYLSGGSFWLGNWKTALDYRHSIAIDPIRKESIDDIALSTYTRMPYHGGLGGGVGLTDNSRMFTWNAKADLDILKGSIGISIAKDAMTDTAQLIENRIRVLTLNASITQRVTDRITLAGSYSFRNYSDDNNANDLQLGASYQLFRQPSIAVGYRFRYFDFQRQSGSGYFDPNNFISNAIFANLSFDHARTYGHVEPYVGFQDFKRDGTSTNDFFSGASGLLGYRFSKHFAVEATAEGGNYAAQTSGGFTYYQGGGRLIVIF